MISAAGVAVLAVVAASSSAAAPAARTKIAVMEIKPHDEASKKQVGLLQEVVLGDFAKADRFDVIGKSDIEAMLGLERQKQLLGCSDDASTCLAELGGALGADYLITGSLARIDQTQRLDLKMIDTRANRVAKRDYVNARSDAELLEATQKMVAGFVAVIPDTRPKPQAAPLPWAGIGTTAAGGVLALVGGLSTLAITSDFNTNRAAIPIDRAIEMEGQANLGLIGLGVGAAVTGVGLWLILSQPPPVAVSVTPTQAGWSLVMAGRFE